MARSAGGGRSSGGSSSGGRSMGGGSRSGSRSFSGGGRSGSISSGSTRRTPSGGGGGSHSNYNHNNHHHNSHNHNSHHHHHHHSYYGRNRYYSGGSGGQYHSSGSGCLSSITFALILILIFSVYFMNGNSFSPSPKLNRDKYNGSVDSSHGYFTDTCEVGNQFIDSNNQATLNSGFKTFYNKTGVFPHLYIIEELPSGTTPEKYNDQLYEELFTSEGNFLILYIAEYDDYYFCSGYDTVSIIDEESLDLITKKINNNWTNSSYKGDLAKIFGNGLEKASKDIMAKSNFVIIVTTIIVGIVLIIIVNVAFKFWKAKKAQINKENEDLEKILDKPLESFGTTDMDDLKDKYNE